MPSALKYITGPGDYGDLTMMGLSRYDQFGIVINAWSNDPKDFVYIKSIEVPNTFVPIINQGNCNVYIENIYAHSFGGDGMNLRGSNTFIENIEIEGSTPVRPYKTLIIQPGDTVEQTLDKAEITVFDPSIIVPVEHKGNMVIPGYHVDAIQMAGMAYGKYVSTPDDELSNIVLSNVSIHMPHKMMQGISLTETCEYKNITIGNESLKIQLEYFYSVIATNLNTFTVGNPNDSSKNVVNKPVRFSEVKQTTKPYGISNGLIAIQHDNHIIDADDPESIIIT